MEKIRCTVDDLSIEEKKIFCFMIESERVNGKIIVPPEMLKQSQEILKKLGMADD